VGGGYPELYRATSVEDAVRELAELGGDGAALAGCTWIMRAPSRGERLKARYVSLQDLDELLEVEDGDPVRIGARATHARAAGLDRGIGPLGALSRAAALSANRAVRNVATVGGNLCATPFPASDVMPALIASEATVETVGPDGRLTRAVEEFLAARDSGAPGELVVQIAVPAPAGRRSTYERLTVRGSGEYPIAGVAVSVDWNGDVVAAARVAVGGVEELARRSGAAEAALVGRRPSAELGEEAGRAAAGELRARDGADAPAWYRLAVLPTLVREAVARLAG
jgi:carbon-monoxide dehydrogenase medium subunit